MTKRAAPDDYFGADFTAPYKFNKMVEEFLWAHPQEREEHCDLQLPLVMLAIPEAADADREERHDLQLQLVMLAIPDTAEPEAAVPMEVEADADYLGGRGVDVVGEWFEWWQQDGLGEWTPTWPWRAAAKVGREQAVDFVGWCEWWRRDGLGEWTSTWHWRAGAAVKEGGEREAEFVEENENDVI